MSILTSRDRDGGAARPLPSTVGIGRDANGPRTSKSNPESPFRVVERWAWALFLQRRHLLPQSDVLQHQVGAAPTHRPNDTDAK